MHNIVCVHVSSFHFLPITLIHHGPCGFPSCHPSTGHAEFKDSRRQHDTTFVLISVARDVETGRDTPTVAFCNIGASPARPFRSQPRDLDFARYCIPCP